MVDFSPRFFSHQEVFKILTESPFWQGLYVCKASLSLRKLFFFKCLVNETYVKRIRCSFPR